MQGFVDLHAHILFGTDDGAKNPGMMRTMLDTAYETGTRVLCATPHYHPGFFGETGAPALAAFAILEEYARECPGMQVFLGNELRYAPGCISWLDSGACRTLGGSRFVLVDFSAGEEERVILRGLKELLSAGYRPVLAHVERYRRLRSRSVSDLVSDGVLLSVDADSLFGKAGLRAKWRGYAMLKEQQVALVASDMHDVKCRPPVLLAAYRAVCKCCGTAYADAVFRENPLRIIMSGKEREKNE